MAEKEQPRRVVVEYDQRPPKPKGTARVVAGTIMLGALFFVILLYICTAGK